MEPTERAHLLLKAQIQPGRRYKDGSVSIAFVTAEEIGTDKFAEIDSYRGQNGWLLFGLNQLNLKNLPKADATNDETMPLHERQRKALYKLFMLQGGRPENFHTFYREQMEVFLSTISDKIEAKEHGA